MNFFFLIYKNIPPVFYQSVGSTNILYKTNLMKYFSYKEISSFYRSLSLSRIERSKKMSRYNTCIILTILLFVFTQSCYSLTQGASEIWMSGFSSISHKQHTSYKGAKEYDESFTREIEVLKKVIKNTIDF